MSAVRDPAAIESTARTPPTNGASATHASRICCGFTASTTRVAAPIASRVVRSWSAAAGKRTASFARCSA
jgi:hypothetical protein